MPVETDRPVAEYQRKRELYHELRDVQLRRSRVLAHARLAVFILLVAAATATESFRSIQYGIASIVLAVAFVALVVAHRRVRDRADWLDGLARMQRFGLARLNRDWRDLPVRTADLPIESHPYALDLDIFGRGAVAQLLGVTSVLGDNTLEHWLLIPSTKAEIDQRHAAVHELRDRPGDRDAVSLLGSRTNITRSSLDAFFEWAEQRPWLTENHVLQVLIFVVPLLTLGLATTGGLGLTPGSLWLAPFIVSLIIVSRTHSRTSSTFRSAFENERTFEGVPELLERMVSMRASASRLVELTRELEKSLASIRKLSRLSHRADMSNSMVGGMLKLFLLWDLHTLAALEKWQKRYGATARAAFDALGEFEALVAIGTLSYDHPSWCTPEIIEGAPELTAVSAGHPLLRDDVRVDNDVELQTDRFLLLTGSNMSGKSTLLRSIGVNTVLALAGAPACATNFRVAHVALHTSIRKQDSLLEGVSLFMSELMKMRRIIDAADAATASGDLAVLFLVDELLQGTNTEERRHASQSVINRLLASHAFGIVSTHDLTILDGSSLKERADLKHFTEVVGEDTISFDYKLKDGLATSRNALRLLRLLGIDT